MFACLSSWLAVHPSVCLSVLVCLFSSEATNSFAEEQKVSAVRKVYQEACSQPLLDVETVWKDYQAFEQVGLGGSMCWGC